MLNYVWVSALVFVLDQVSKWWVTSWLSLYESVPVTSFFNIMLTHNRGAAFSFLAQAGGWQRWFFVVMATVVSAILLVWLKRLRARAKLEALAVSMVLGGALGNLIDRLMLGYVVDFLDFHWQNVYHFPTFNIADSAICVGATLLIISTLLAKSG